MISRINRVLAAIRPAEKRGFATDIFSEVVLRRLEGVASNQPIGGGEEFDVSRACIRICERHPDQTWRFLNGRRGAEDRIEFVTCWETAGYVHPPPAPVTSARRLL